MVFHLTVWHTTKTKLNFTTCMSNLEVCHGKLMQAIFQCSYIDLIHNDGYPGLPGKELGTRTSKSGLCTLMMDV